jgi:hypothetical protein
MFSLNQIAVNQKLKENKLPYKDYLVRDDSSLEIHLLMRADDVHLSRKTKINNAKRNKDETRI